MQYFRLLFLIVLLLLVSITLSVKAQDQLERHCIAQADRLDSEREIVQQGNGQVTCFDTIAEALFAASGGTIVLPPDIQASEITGELVEQHTNPQIEGGLSTQSNYLLATYWEHAYKGGSSISKWAPRDCSIFDHWGWSFMPSGWDNRVSSTVSYSACGFNELSENPHHQGAKLNCGYTGCENWVGTVMDDQTSSTYLKPW